MSSTLPAVAPSPVHDRFEVPPRRRAKSRATDSKVLWLTVPALAWYALFTIGPILGMFAIGFLEWGGLIDTPSWAGLGNFAAVLSDPVFYTAAGNTFLHVIAVVPVMMPLAFMLGYYLNTKPRGYRLLSILFFTPGLISISIKGTIFYGVLSPTGGLNGLLSAVGLQDIATAWLANPETALWSIIAIDLWSGIGWTAVLFAARLSSVSTEVLEAAEMDGAGQTRKMWQITFPMIRDYFGTLAMLQFLWTLFNSAAIVLILTKGGPGTSSTTLSYLVYQKAFQQQDLGYSQAAGILLFALGLAGMLLIRRVIRPAF